MRKKLVIATRRSPMALWQAEWIRNILSKKNPELELSLLPLVTEGDQRLGESLAKIGGKGLFLKELEQAILKREAHLAVHSLKDIPAIMSAQFSLPAICYREEVRDVLLSNGNLTLQQLPQGARVGTSSLRRQSQLLALREDLQIVPLRGNVNTRINKLREGNQYDAIVLSGAGMLRLGFGSEVTEWFEPSMCLPAAGQGALALQCLAEDIALNEWLKEVLDECDTRACVEAERSVSEALDASCTLPLAAYAEIVSGKLHLRALVGSADGKTIIKTEAAGAIEEARQLGEQVARSLIQLGALPLLNIPHA